MDESIFKNSEKEPFTQEVMVSKAQKLLINCWRESDVDAALETMLRRLFYEGQVGPTLPDLSKAYSNLDVIHGISLSFS